MGAKLCKLDPPAKEEDRPPAVTLILPFDSCPGTVGSVPLQDSSPVPGHSCFTEIRTQEPRLHPHGALPVLGPPHQLPGPGVPLSGREHEFLVCGPGARVFISLGPLAQQGSSLSSRLHPRDAELLHPGHPVGPDLHGLSGHVLHPFTVCPWTRPHCLHLHGLCWSPVLDSGHDGLHH